MACQLGGIKMYVILYKNTAGGKWSCGVRLFDSQAEAEQQAEFHRREFTGALTSVRYLACMSDIEQRAKGHHNAS